MSPPSRPPSYLFDDDVVPEWTEKFLRQPNHHLCIAYVDEEPAGFVSGVEITHPDKGTEMLLYELGVDDDFRRQGIGRRSPSALRDLALSRGCTGVWVPVDDDNEPAIGMYRSLEPDEEARTVIVWWDLGVDEPVDGRLSEAVTVSWIERVIEERLAQAAAAGELDAPHLNGKPLPDLDRPREQGWWADQFVRRELSHDRRKVAEAAAAEARAGFWRADDRRRAAGAGDARPTRRSRRRT